MPGLPDTRSAQEKASELSAQQMNARLSDMHRVLQAVVEHDWMDDPSRAGGMMCTFGCAGVGSRWVGGGDVEHEEVCPVVVARRLLG